MLSNGDPAKAVREGVICTFDIFDDDPASSTRPRLNIVQVIELTQPGLRAPGFQGWRFHHQDRKAAGSELFPTPEEG